MTKFIVNYIIPADDNYPYDAHSKIDHDSFEEAFCCALYLWDIAEDIVVLNARTGEVLYGWSDCFRRWNRRLMLPQLRATHKRKHQSLISKQFCKHSHSAFVTLNNIMQRYGTMFIDEDQRLTSWDEWCKAIYKRGRY